MTFQFQIAQFEDAEWIAKFQINHASEVEELQLAFPTVLKGVQQLLKMPDTGFYLSCKTEHNIPAACVLVLKEWSDWRATWVWWIHSVFVDTPHRGNALFEKMYALLKTKAQLEHVAGLRLYVDKRNARAQHIYKKIGMSNEHYELFEELF